MKNLPFELKHYTEQFESWPQQGRHILGTFDAENIVVYQAYRPEIGHYAARSQQFGGAFSFTRMSWIKPNFLWMMYRSGWGTKEGQEITLAVTIKRSLFDEILSAAVASSFHPDDYPTRDEWKQALGESEVRLQWDPDHAPDGSSVERRAIQLGLRGRMLERYAREEVVRIDDISEFVEEQRENLQGDLRILRTPSEKVYLPASQEAASNVGIQNTQP